MTTPINLNLNFALATHTVGHCSECPRRVLAEVKVTNEDTTSHTDEVCSKHLAENYSPLAADILLAHAVDYPNYLD